MPKSVYEVVTDRVLQQLEAGVVPWKQSWFGKAISYASGKPYRGANILWLRYPGEYVTYSQIIANKGELIKGATSFPVVFKKREVEKYRDANGDTQDKVHWITKYYKVYHVLEAGLEPKHTKDLMTEHTPIEKAEALIDAYLAKRELYVFHDRPIYYPDIDQIGMPNMEFYEVAEDYYSNMFHEIAHSTGHIKRLNRQASLDVETKSYALEELVAELTSAMIMSYLNIDISKTQMTSASYIKGWMDKISADKTLVSKAGLQAQKATEYILKSLEVQYEK